MLTNIWSFAIKSVKKGSIFFFAAHRAALAHSLADRTCIEVLMMARAKTSVFARVPTTLTSSTSSLEVRPGLGHSHAYCGRRRMSSMDGLIDASSAGDSAALALQPDQHAFAAGTSHMSSSF